MARLLLLLCLIFPVAVNATDVFHYKDKYGRPVFSDTPTQASPQQRIHIDIPNDYDWHNPKLRLNRTVTPQKKKSRKRKKKTYSFAELQSRCTKARYRYQNFRGAKSNSDWGNYKSKIMDYAQKRDYWCSRALKRK